MRKIQVYFVYFGDLELRFDGDELIMITNISAIRGQNRKRGGSYVTDLLQTASYMNKL
jgi:hypothetical protein